MNICYSHLNEFIYPHKEINNLLNINEIKKNYLKLLSELSFSPEITNELFIYNIKNIFKSGLILVAHININNTLHFIGTGTLWIKKKLSNGGKSVGHIEDLVILKEYQNKGIDKEIINYFIKYCKIHNCYKVILYCSPEFEGYYKKKGFINQGSSMVLKFKD
jgi:glucosamine-phosphate N-acetyltransferase